MQEVSITPDEKMGGLPLSRTMSADGRWAYTLYTGGEETFVHALDTLKGQARCIDVGSVECGVGVCQEREVSFRDGAQRPQRGCEPLASGAGHDEWFPHQGLVVGGELLAQQLLDGAAGQPVPPDCGTGDARGFGDPLQPQRRPALLVKQPGRDGATRSAAAMCDR